MTRQPEAPEPKKQPPNLQSPPEAQRAAKRAKPSAPKEKPKTPKKRGRKPGQKRVRAPASKRQLRNEELNAQVVALRKEGLSFDAIGEKLEIDGSTAYRHWSSVMKRLVSETDDDADVLRRLELDRIDEWLREARAVLLDPVGLGPILGTLDEVSPEALAELLRGSAAASDLKLKAIDRLDKLSDSRRKLLGLYAPTKGEITGKNGAPLNPAGQPTPEEVAAMVREEFGEHAAKRTSEDDEAPYEAGDHGFSYAVTDEEDATDDDRAAAGVPSTPEE